MGPTVPAPIQAFPRPEQTTRGVRIPALLAALLLCACAQGGGAAEQDSSVHTFDAGNTADAASPGLDAADTGVDAGAGKPCTPANATSVCGAQPCVDGFCCNSPCTDTCESCGLPWAEGVCSPYAVDTDPESECASESSATCGTTGHCDGDGACAYYDSSTSCDDGDECTTGDVCDGAGGCAGSPPTACSAGNECQEHTCGGTTYYCTESGGTWAWTTTAACDDGDDCTHTDQCGSGVCAGTGVDCSDTTCLEQTCNGTATCTGTPINVGLTCDDGNAASDNDLCQSDGTCLGTFTCPATLTSVFSDDFATPSSSSWTDGTDAVVNTSRWKATTLTYHGVRVYNGLLEITNKRGSSGPSHGHGYAYVKTGGTDSHYDNGLYNATLKSNADQEVVWSFNMRRDDPDSTDGGFSCDSTASQNRVTVGLAYVLATDSVAGLNASTSTCSASGTALGYAVVMGGDSGKVRLVRFSGGLRNGAITNIVSSGGFDPDRYFSVRVTYNTVTDLWQLEARSDGASSFSDPAAGTYGFTGTGTDTTHVNTALEYSGPYFQSGCTGNCSETYTTRFDNVQVGLRCAP